MIIDNLEDIKKIEDNAYYIFGPPKTESLKNYYNTSSTEEFKIRNVFVTSKALTRV